MSNPTEAATDSSTAAAQPASGLPLIAFRLVSLAFAALGFWVMWSALDMQYYTPVGPGPGFFPMWLGGALALLSFAILGASFVSIPALPAGFIPKLTPLMQMGVTFASVAFFALFVERIGFVATMFLVLLVLMLVNRVRLFPIALLVALGGSLGVAYAFVQWLGVFLPATPFGLLSAIGL